MFVYANAFFALFISLLFKSLEAQCATRYHFSQPETPSIINIRSRTVNTLPEKRGKTLKKWFNLVIFSPSSRMFQLFLPTTYSCKWANYCQWNTNIYCFSCNELMKNVFRVCKNCYFCTSYVCACVAEMDRQTPFYGEIPIYNSHAKPHVSGFCCRCQWSSLA